MAYKTINLEAGRPTAEQAMRFLSQELRMAKASRATALKIIHGYGSTGKGGVIRTEARKMLRERKARGQIRDFVAGEEFSLFTEAGRAAGVRTPELKKDPDYGRGNPGVTIVILG